MCYVVHNHGMAIEAHSQLFPLQPNVAELGGSSIYKTISRQKINHKGNC